MMGQSLVHKLEKKDRDRHFPESNGGKGSHARKSDKKTREAAPLMLGLVKGYDAIDWDLI